MGTVTKDKVHTRFDEIMGQIANRDGRVPRPVWTPMNRHHHEIGSLFLPSDFQLFLELCQIVICWINKVNSRLLWQKVPSISDSRIEGR